MNCGKPFNKFNPMSRLHPLFLIFPIGSTLCLEGTESLQKTNSVSAPSPTQARVSDTFVFSVDQASSSQPMTWTHRVAETGDYQLGMAWVELLSGEEVEVTIKAAGKIVRSVTVRRGLEPQRLDTRVEKLAAGDEITVAANPSPATYRLGYQIAFCTPTFPGAKIFHVKDFGAVGDGVADDFAAIQKAVISARESGCAILQFDGSKTYLRQRHLELHYLRHRHGPFQHPFPLRGREVREQQVRRFPLLVPRRAQRSPDETK